MSQIKLLLDIVSDLKHLSDSLEEYARAVAQNEKLSLNDFEQIYPPVEDENTVINAVPEKETEPLKVTSPLSSRQHKKQKRSPKYPKAVCAICAGCFLLVVVGKPLSQRGAKRRTEKGACRGARPVTQYTLHGIP